MSQYLQYPGFWTPGPLELVVILVVAVLLFGRRLPEIARNLGKSLTEFKRGIHEAKDAKDELADEVRDIKNDVVNQAKDATGLNDFDKN